MFTKIAIFGFVSTILVAAIYSSSAFVQFAFSEAYCAHSPDGNRYTCIVTWPKGVYVGNCTKDSAGKVTCKITDVVRQESSLPPDLNDALDNAIQEFPNAAIEESPNDTKGPKTGVLDEPGALSDDESTENGDDTKVPKGLGGLNNNDGLTINPDLP
jgi:hypothetical protein